MTDAVSRIAALVHEQSGIRLQPGQHAGLVATMRRVWPGLPSAELLRLVSDRTTGPSVLAKLIDELTVKETFFLRDECQLESIDWHALHASARAAGSDTIRVWSVPCATGEEPYSLGLLACEAFTTLAPPVRILATDISTTALAAAERGVYGERSLRAVGGMRRERYFVRSGERLAVSRTLRDLVSFRAHNLVRDPIPPLGEGSFELILCRNILIYFDPETTGRLTAALGRALAPGGRLVLGAADALTGTAARLAKAAEPAPQTARPRASIPRRRPLGRRPEVPVDDRVREPALTSALVGDDSPDAGDHFVRGLVELEAGDAAAAVWSLRRAVYLEPGFGLAAFKLARAHDALGDETAARRAYEQALRALSDDDGSRDDLLGQIDAADVAAACRSRLAALATAPQERGAA